MRSRTCTAVLVALIGWISSGCATPRLEPSVSERFRAKDMAAAVVLLDKSIQYNEMVYKVLWNETRTHTSQFDGFWDADKTLTDAMVESMGEVGMRTRPVSSVLRPKQYAQFVSALKSTKNPDGTYAPLTLDQKTRTSLKKAGIGSVAVVRSANFMISTTVFNKSGLMHLPSVLLVYDVDTGKQEYAHVFPVAGGVKWGESVRDIESNNLQSLREASPAWIENSVKRQMPRVFNFESN